MTTRCSVGDDAVDGFGGVFGELRNAAERVGADFGGAALAPLTIARLGAGAAAAARVGLARFAA